MFGRKLFGEGIKYPLYRFAGLPDCFMRKRLYLDFTGRKRDKSGLKPFERDITPGFETVCGLNMIDAGALRHAKTNSGGPGPLHASGD